MKASVVDLRYKMSNILKALDRNECVTILYHGKVKGTIIPNKKKEKKQKVNQHPIFGMLKNEDKSVSDVMEDLRGNRYHDI